MNMQCVFGLVSLCGTCLGGAQLLAQGADAKATEKEKTSSVLEQLQSPDDQVRLAALLKAPELGAAAVEPLAKVFEEGSQQARITAGQALTRIVHHAGRPGADAERAAVVAALVRLTAPGRSPPLRREAVHLIAFIGSAKEEVEAVELCLWDEDRHLAEYARMALERMPGKEAYTALENAVRRAPDQDRPELIYSLSKKGERSAAPFLLKLVRSRHPKTRLAVFEGLARLGAVEAVPAFAEAVADAKDPDLRRIYNEYLRLADQLVEGGGAPQAREVYLSALRGAPADYQRERALHRLAPEGAAEVVDVLIAGLGDESPRVRGLALRRLELLEGARVLAALKRAYEEARDENRAFLLRALADRDREAARAFVDRAAASSNLELKIVALDLSGKLRDPSLAGEYVRLAQSGSAVVRPVALKGYLELADAELASGSKARALEMFGRALELAAQNEERARALRGLIAVGDPKAIDLLGPYLQDPVLSQEAAAAHVRFAAAIGAGGDVERAAKHLTTVVDGSFPQDLVLEAARELRRLGRDPQGVARAKGFLLEWWLVGPIQDLDAKGLETPYFPEEHVRLDTVETIGARRFRWQEYKGLSRDGRIDLQPVFRRAERVIAYAFAEIEVASDQDAALHFGSDDGIACWLNGERVHLKNAGRTFKLDEDRVEARLKMGKNRVLVKVSQRDGDWAFAVRVSDRGGKALDVGQRRF